MMIRTRNPKLQRGFSALSVVLLLVVVVVIAGTGYYVYRAKTDTERTLDATATPAPAPKAADTQKEHADGHMHSAKDHEAIVVSDARIIVTGQVDFNADGQGATANDMYFDVQLMPSDKLREIWVQYGTAPDKLTGETVHNTKGFGEGVAGQYAYHRIPLAKDKLQPGASYYYRAVAKLADGSIVYGGIAAFQNIK